MPAMNIKKSMPMSSLRSYAMPQEKMMMAQPKMAMKKSAGLGIGDMMSSLGSSIASSVSGLFGTTSSKKKSISDEKQNLN
jgi:hypothetical protein